MILQTVHDSPPWHVALAPGQGDDLVIAFSSIGHDATRPPSPEFVASATAGGRRALFITDASRSWGLDPGFAPAVQAGLAAAGPARRSLAIGSSMGAVCALRAAHLAPMTTVLAFGPQSTLTDPRWHHWTAGLGTPALPAFATGVWHVLFHGHADDHQQAQGFPEAASVDHILYPGIHHSDLGPHLKSKGALTGLIDAALAHDRRRLLRITASTGGVQRRKSMGL
ncbi:MAG: hypothetical protein C0427_04700 [Rhodobacter sp.]|nr:hypothetical protein [Rhodobacter sp.]